MPSCRRIGLANATDPSLGMTQPRWPIPDEWAWRDIGDIGDVRGGGTPSARRSSNFSDVDGVPWITPADMSGHLDTYIARGRRNLSEEGLASSGAQLLPSGTVVFSSRAPIGYCAVAANALATSQGCKNVILNGSNVPEYLMFYLRHSKAYAESLASGTTFLELSAAKMKTLAVPVPPSGQQEAISVALDHLLGRVRFIRSLIADIPNMAAVWSTRLLTDAYDGRLTTDWRREASAPPPKLARVAEFLATPIRNGLSVRGRDDPPGVRALRLSALRTRRVDLEDVRFLPIPEGRAARFLLKDGDVLVSRGNGTKALVGRAALVEGLDEPTIYPDTAFRLRTNRNRVLPAWFALVWNAPQVRRRIEAAARTTAGIWKIRQTDVTALDLPLPSRDEQEEVAGRVEYGLSRIDNVLRNVAMVEDTLTRLETKVLSLAFRGEFATDAVERLLNVTLSELRLLSLDMEDLAPPQNASPNDEGPVKMGRVLKSRLDPEIRDTPYLANLLVEQSEEVLSAKALFELSELSIVDFYKQLAWEVDTRFLAESGHGFRNGR